MMDYSLLTKLDRLVHNPGRQAILAVLVGCEWADFTYLERATALNKGTLSKHLSVLEEAGYIEILKQFKGKLPNTRARLTPAGRKAFKNYRKQYKALLEAMEPE